ncbi:MAG TPA: serine/threonine-protein kinase [Nannocystaceae bacterium]|nr:serine/threonine-protein kinase [Nannocystaceae bacterium]
MGEQLGGYELISRLGAGGMAEVWLGMRRVPGEPTRTAAIKVAKPERGRDPKTRRLFRREAEVGMLLQHANIVRVLDHGETDDTCFVVMEHVDGASLLRLEPALAAVCDERLRMQLAVHIVLQVLKALSYAHRVRSDAGYPLGVVHRDISPHNVLISHAGEVKLADWGVSHLAPSISMHQSIGEIYGKPRYMAPEHIAGQHRDPRIDLFAAGAVLHELLDARTFRGDQPTMRILPLVLTGKRPPLSRRIPGELERVLEGLLAPDPEQRTPNARAAIDGLRRWAFTSDMSEEWAELCRRVCEVEAPRTNPPLPAERTTVAPPPRMPRLEESVPPPLLVEERTVIEPAPRGIAVQRVVVERTVIAPIPQAAITLPDAVGHTEPIDLRDAIEVCDATSPPDAVDPYDLDEVVEHYEVAPVVAEPEAIEPVDEVDRTLVHVPPLHVQPIERDPLEVALGRWDCDEEPTRLFPRR